MKCVRGNVVMVTLAVLGAGVGVARAEVAREPALLVLENGVSKLEAKFKGTTSAISTLGGKKYEASGLEMEFKRCTNGASEKDTTGCIAVTTFTGWKKESVSCRSESTSGAKDASETVLVDFALGIANSETTAKALQPLALFKVLGEESTETGEEL